LKYALLIYANSDRNERAPEEEKARTNAQIAQVLERPEVTGWLRLQGHESATTVNHDRGQTLVTDGPFVDSKDFLGGLIVVEAENLDGAIALADELQAVREGAGAIEVRPLREDPLVGA